MNQQIEMSLEQCRDTPNASRSEVRLRRASWWFRRMHCVVESAQDWLPLNEPTRSKRIAFKQRSGI